VIILLNGAFGIGKTTVARVLVSRLPRAILFDPELIGIALQRTLRLSGRTVHDFQDLPLWRRLTVTGLRATRLAFTNIVVPMAISNPAYLQELRDGIGRFDAHVFHYCLRAPIEVVHERLRLRGDDHERASWSYQRAVECCQLHGSDTFARHIDAADQRPQEIAERILRFCT
jgi:predicted kinase